MTTAPEPEWTRHLNAELHRMRDELGHLEHGVRGLRGEVQTLHQAIAQLTTTIERLTQALQAPRPRPGHEADPTDRD